MGDMVDMLDMEDMAWDMEDMLVLDMPVSDMLLLPLLLLLLPLLLLPPPLLPATPMSPPLPPSPQLVLPLLLFQPSEDSTLELAGMWPTLLVLSMPPEFTILTLFLLEPVSNKLYTEK